eukprot:gene8604-8785_t
MTRVFLEEDAVAFTRLTGDSNPIHTDVSAAAAAGLSGTILPGMLMAAMFPAIIGSRFPGALYLTQTLKFRRQAAVGSEITAEVTLTARSVAMEVSGEEVRAIFCGLVFVDRNTTLSRCVADRRRLIVQYSVEFEDQQDADEFYEELSPQQPAAADCPHENPPFPAVVFDSSSSHLPVGVVADVCDWLEAIGLPQYRKKLMHHCIDGRLLLRLDDHLLKTELGIGPLGHRAMIEEAVQALRHADVAEAAAAAAAGNSANSAGAARGGQRSPPRPSSAPSQGRPISSTAQQGLHPGALGPAAGRISIHEQRAKLLFELGRAQARAAAVSGSAAQVQDVARIAAEDVARLQGQLADLDHKNRMQVAHAAGSVDSKGQIPWQHVGPGTRAAHPHPESHARPWDSPGVDLTFQPRISRTSQRIMAEARGQGGAGGFLDRLDNDLRKRQSKMKELQKRYQPGAAADSSASDATEADKAAAADLQLIAAFFNQRGWASIDPPRGKGASALSPQQLAELDDKINQVVEDYAKELGLTGLPQVEAHRAAILAAPGAKKVAAVAAAVRTCQFMDRYKADLSTRDIRLQELQNNWFKQQNTKPGAVPPEQRDMAQATAWFEGLGWDLQDDDCDDLLSALIKRSRAYKDERERDDGLGPKMRRVMEVQATGKTAKAAPASRSRTTVSAGSNAAASDASGSGSGSSVSDGNDLDRSVTLLAGMTWAGLDQLTAATGKAKLVAVFRSLRTQQFLASTAADLEGREAKQRAVWQEVEASRRGKLLSRAQLDEFYSRLQADGVRRKAQLEKARADQEDKEAKALAQGAHSSRSRPRSAAASTARPRSAPR